MTFISPQLPASHKTHKRQTDETAAAVTLWTDTEKQRDCTSQSFPRVSPRQ